MLGALLDLAAPSLCAGCRWPGAVLCAGCADRLAAARPQHRTVPTAAGPLPVTAAHPYDRLVAGLLVAHKERARRGLAGPLGAALEQGLPSGPVLVVPVPSRRSARRSRGFDHAEVLARAAVRGHPGAVCWPALVLRRRVRDSAGLAAPERVANLDGAMVVRPGRPPAAVRAALADGLALCLVDDVCTTGTSLAEAARALRTLLPEGVSSAATVAMVGSGRGSRSTRSGLSRTPREGSERASVADPGGPPPGSTTGRRGSGA